MPRNLLSFMTATSNVQISPILPSVIMNSSSVSLLRYRNAAQAIAWLRDAFGFEVFLEVKGEDEQIEHARLILGSSLVMIASIGREGPFEQRFRLPRDVGGVTQGTLLVVADPARIYASAKRAGATIIDELARFELGGSTFSCEDLESHVWVFTSHDPWKKQW